MELWAEGVHPRLVRGSPSGLSAGAWPEGELCPGRCVATGLVTEGALGQDRPGPGAPVWVSGHFRVNEMVDTGPLGRVQGFTRGTVSVYADGGESTERECEAPLATPAGFRRCLRVGLAEVRRMDSDGDFLSSCKVCKCDPAPLH